MKTILQIRTRLKAIKLDRNAILITALYLLIGGLWILLSDRFAEAISKDIKTLTTISTYKGWGYVLVTGLILYWLIHLNNSRLQKENEELQIAKKNYKDIFDNASVGIYRSTPDGRLLTVNSALASMFGYTSPDEMLASISDIGSQVYKDSARREGYQKTITEQGFINEFVNEERRKDGSWIWTSTTVRAVKDEAGNILYYEGFSADVTKRKQIEEALRNSEENYKLMFEQAPLAINITHGSAITYANPAYLMMFGFSSLDELQSVGPLELFTPEWRPRILENIKRRAKGLPTPNNYEAECLRKDGTKFPILMYLTNAMFSAQQVTLGFILDITERKRAEQALINSEYKYHSLVEEIPVVTYSASLDHKSIYVSPLIEKFIGFSPDEWLADSELWVKSLHPEDRQRVLEENANALTDGSKYTVEYRMIARDGRTIWIHDEGRILSTSADSQQQIQGIWQDITERKHAEETLHDNESRYRSIFEGVQDAIFVEAMNGRILDVNQRACEIFDYSREVFLTKSVRDLVPSASDIFSIHENDSEGSYTRPVEVMNVRASGEKFPAELSPRSLILGNQRVLLVILRDISERKKAEENLRRRLTELELVYDNGLELGRILEPEEIAQKIIEQMENRLNWHHSTVRLYNPESQTLKIIGFNVPGLENEIDREGLEGHFNNLIQKSGDGLSGLAIQRGQTLRIGDLKRDPQYVETFPGLNSGLYVPIHTENRIIGVISVENELPDAFSESDERLVGTLANQAAIALENSRLHNETQQQLNRLRALHSVDLAITNSLDLNVTLDVLLTQVIQQLQVDAAVIYLKEANINDLKYVTSKGFYTHLLENVRPDQLMNESHAGRAILERRAIEAQAPLEGRLKEIWMAEGFHSTYAIPLLSKGDPKGVMEVFSRSADQTIAIDQMSFLETLAGQAAIAIENLHLFNGLQRSNMELAIAYDATIEGWSRAMDLRDKETEGHTKRVVDMTLKLAADFDFSGEMLMHIRHGALLHDIGKLGVPDNILLKPDKLTDEEWLLMKKHPTFAFEMLAPIQYLNRAINIPYCHHEKWDGTGYPRGLSDEQIPLEARIFAVVDVWDAITSDRPYRKAWTNEKAMEHIRSLAGTHFDPRIAERFLELKKEENRQQPKRAKG